MANDNLYDRFNLDLSLAERTGFNPYYPQLQSALTDPIVLNDEEFINLATNNYLGLADDSRIKEAAINAIKKYGLSMCSTPIAGGCFDLVKQAELKLAAFTGVESCIIYPSCYQANNGLFKSIAQKDDLILVDHYAHSSLVEGIKGSMAKFRPFLHNNTDHLEDILKKNDSNKQTFVVTESVFSTEGSLAPLAELDLICKKYNAILVIDDSHGIGVIGKNGRGALSYIKDFNGIYTASLGKAIANAGGMIGGNKKIIEYLKYNSSHFIYSTALPPSVLGGIMAAIDIIEKEFDSISEKMFRYKKIVEDAINSSGFITTKNNTAIISIEAGNSEQTISQTFRFYKNKLLTTPFIFPSVPEKSGRIRIIAGANLREQTIEKAASIIKKMA